MAVWIGVDVGGKRKGFDAALIDEQRLLALHDHLDVTGVLELVANQLPAVVAIDSPRCFAPEGQTSRNGERELANAICGIRWTPDAARADGSYYAWIHEGLALYTALDGAGPEVIEVFPTASWTRWFGPRGSRSRADWTMDGLTQLDLDRLPKRTNQDQRDAIAAALTARLHAGRKTEAMGEIVVPLASGQPPYPRRELLRLNLRPRPESIEKLRVHHANVQRREAARVSEERKGTEADIRDWFANWPTPPTRAP